MRLPLVWHCYFEVLFSIYLAFHFFTVSFSFNDNLSDYWHLLELLPAGTELGDLQVLQRPTGVPTETLYRGSFQSWRGSGHKEDQSQIRNPHPKPESNICFSLPSRWICALKPSKKTEAFSVDEDTLAMTPVVL